MDYDLEFVFPPALLVKPLFGSMQSYASAVTYHAMRGNVGRDKS